MLTALHHASKKLTPLAEPYSNVAVLELGDRADLVAYSIYLVVHRAKVGARDVGGFGFSSGNGMNEYAWSHFLDIGGNCADGTGITARVTHACSTIKGRQRGAGKGGSGGNERQRGEKI